MVADSAHPAAPAGVRRLICARRAVAAAVGASLLALWTASPCGAQEEAIAHLPVAGYDPQRGVVSLMVEEHPDLAIGDSMWVLTDDDIVASGTLFLVGEGRCAGRLSPAPKSLPDGTRGVVLKSIMLTDLRNQMPPRVTIRGEVSRLVPGRQTAWLNLGSAAGLVVDDGVLIRRKGIPIARGRIAVVSEQAALTTVQPVVGNAVIETGDSAELWPEPADRRLRRVRSSVLATQPGEQGTAITVVGTTGDGFFEGRVLDLLRDGRYIGVASISQVFNPISVAQVTAAATLETPAVGDQAWLRSPPGPPVRPISAAVFRVDASEGYCLIAAGEVDGLVNGEKLVVRRPDPDNEHRQVEIAELTIDKVNVDYSGAFIRLLSPHGLQVEQWDFAERRSPVRAVWRTVGIVRKVVGRAAVVDVELTAPMSAGTVVRLLPEAPELQPAGSVVLSRSGDHAIVHIVVGWGDAEKLGRAALQIPNQPAETMPSEDEPLLAPAAPPE